MFELKKLLSYDNHPNIIIYNCDNIDSILYILSDIKCKNNIHKCISYINNDIYSIFDIKNINSKNILDFKIYINDIIKKKITLLKKNISLLKI